MPYPPNKGDKIASFNLLRFLAERYEVFVGTFIDDPDDRQHLDKGTRVLQRLCAPEIRPGLARLASLRGLFSGEALSLPYLRSRRLMDWTADVLREHRPERIVIFSGPMAQYVSGRVPEGTITLFDMVDVDSEKWRSYGERKAWPMSWLYRREADKLLAFERRMAREFDSTVFVSREEADLFRGLAPESAHKTTYRIQGVDSDFFDPRATIRTLSQRGAGTGVYRCDGLLAECRRRDLVRRAGISRIRAAVPDALFCIVGMRPAQVALADAPRHPGNLDRCPDVRHYLAHAHAALPLRIARGYPEQSAGGDVDAAAGDRDTRRDDRDPAVPRVYAARE